MHYFDKNIINLNFDIVSISELFFYSDLIFVYHFNLAFFLSKCAWRLFLRHRSFKFDEAFWIIYTQYWDLFVLIIYKSNKFRQTYNIARPVKKMFPQIRRKASQVKEKINCLLATPSFQSHMRLLKIDT